MGGRLTDGVRDQRGNTSFGGQRPATGGQVDQDIPPLLLTGDDDGEERLHKPTALIALRPVTALAPQHGMSQALVELSEGITSPAGLQTRACYVCAHNRHT